MSMYMIFSKKCNLMFLQFVSFQIIFTGELNQQQLKKIITTLKTS